METKESRIASSDRDFFLYRIINDELWYDNKVKLVIKSPSNLILLKAQDIYNKVLSRCEKLGLSSDKDILNLIKYTSSLLEKVDTNLIT